MHRTIILTLAMAFMLATTGCMGSALQNRDESSPEKQKQVVQAQSVGAYQEFDDVLIPNGMERIYEESSVTILPTFKMGIITYKGDLNAAQLAHFFEKELNKDNWKMRSNTQFQKRFILVFEKPDRDCIINITDETFKTLLEVMVTPRLDPGSASGQPQEVQVAPVEESLPQ